MFRLDERERSVRFKVRAQPRAARSEVSGTYGDAIRIRLAAPPVEGAANVELIAFLAKKLGISKSAVRLVKGERSRDKVVEVDGLSAGEVASRLG